MNKQEVIEEIKNLEGLTILDKTINLDSEMIPEKKVLNIVKQLDESEKPVVPQFVAEFIASEQRSCSTLSEAIDNMDMRDDGGVTSWFYDNSETFAKAWLFGYKVDKEKLYTVELPNPNGGTHLVLCKDCDGKLFVETFLIDEWETFGKCKLTEAEIKKEFSWTWQFAKELEDKDQEEKLYTVEFPNPNSDNHLLLRKNFDGKVCVSLLHSEYWRGNESTRLTEAEIKEGFDWAWQFAKEVEE